MEIIKELTEINTSKTTLVYGDCIEVMKYIPDNSIDLILTDPPYGTTYCKWDSIIPLEPMWEQIERIIKTNGNIILFGQEPFSSFLRCSNIKLYKFDWIWAKNACANYPAAKYQPLKYHELIHIFTKSGINNNTKNPIKYNPQGIVEFNKEIKGYNVKTEGVNSYHSMGKDRIQKYTNYPKTILYYDLPKNKVHPTQKPVELIEYLIKTYSNKNEIVLDFTMGSGTTGVACVKTTRKFIGIENDETYFNIGIERMKNAQKDKEMEMVFGS